MKKRESGIAGNQGERPENKSFGNEISGERNRPTGKRYTHHSAVEETVKKIGLLQCLDCREMC
jgi:hypothetical protein